MLSIRMQRIGRKGHPVYRVVVQDSRQTPTSGKYVAMLGSYDPHTKKTTLVKEKAELYLKNGAQPSDRVVRLFASEKVAMPAWVKQPTEQKRDTRNPDKLRKNRPAEATPSEEQSVSDDNTEVVASTDKETTDTKPAEEAGSEEKNSAPEADESAGNTTAENLPPESAEEPAEDKKESA